MDGPNSSTITSKRMSQCDTQRRKTICRFRVDGRETICKEVLKSPSDGLKNIVNIWSRPCQLIAHTQLQGKSVEDMGTITFSA